MAADDFDVIVYKVLSYLYACLKRGVEPNGAKAQEIAKCNSVYFRAVMKSLAHDSLVIGDPGFAWGGEIVRFDVSVSQAGVRYLRENSAMGRVAEFLGKAFELTLEIAVKATSAL